MSLRVAVLLGVCLMTSACTGTSVRDLPELTHWMLLSIDGEAPIKGSQIDLSLDQGSGRITGSAGCNRYSTGYGGDPESPRLSMIGLSKRLCVRPEGIMEQERRFVDAVRQVETLTLAGDQLRMHTRDGRDLIFQRMERVDR